MKVLSVFAFLSAVLMSGQAFAASQSYTCAPAADNSYFTDAMSLSVLSPASIELNGVRLDRDDTYKPRNGNKYVRYTGDTSVATNWQDSGLVEVYLKSGSTQGLSVRVRGEMFISESFSCTAK